MYHLITRDIATHVRRQFYRLISEGDRARTMRYRTYVWDRYGMAPLSLYLVWSQVGDVFVKPTVDGFDWQAFGWDPLP